MPWGSKGDQQGEDETDMRDDIPNGTQHPRPAPELDCFDLATMMLKGMRAMMATMQMGMRRKNHCKPMMDQCRTWGSKGMVGFTCERVMSTGMSMSMATMHMQQKRNKHLMPMIDQHRMLRTEGIVLQRVNIGLNISDL
jgi:hypothetical protein